MRGINKVLLCQHTQHEANVLRTLCRQKKWLHITSQAKIFLEINPDVF